LRYTDIMPSGYFQAVDRPVNDPPSLDDHRNRRPDIVPYSEEDVRYYDNDTRAYELSRARLGGGLLDKYAFGYPTDTLRLPRVRDLLNREMEDRILDTGGSRRTTHVSDPEVESVFIGYMHDPDYVRQICGNRYDDRTNYDDIYRDCLREVELERRGTSEPIRIRVDFESIEEFHPENIDIRVRAALGSHPEVMRVMRTVLSDSKTGSSDAAHFLVDDEVYERDGVAKHPGMRDEHPAVGFFVSLVNAVQTSVYIRGECGGEYTYTQDHTHHAIHLLADSVGAKNAAIVLLRIVMLSRRIKKDEIVASAASTDACARVERSLCLAVQDEDYSSPVSEKHRVHLTLFVDNKNDSRVRVHLTYPFLSDLKPCNLAPDAVKKYLTRHDGHATQLKVIEEVLYCMLTLLRAKFFLDERGRRCVSDSLFLLRRSLDDADASVTLQTGDRIDEETYERAYEEHDAFYRECCDRVAVNREDHVDTKELYYQNYERVRKWYTELESKEGLLLLARSIGAPEALTSALGALRPDSASVLWKRYRDGTKNNGPPLDMSNIKHRTKIHLAFICDSGR